MPEQPIVTIFCAFTRRWAVERWLNDLANVRHDPARTNLAFIVDVDEKYIYNRLDRFAKARGYRTCKIIMNADNAPNPVNFPARRLRIAEMKNQSKFLIREMDGDIIIGLEDDTVFGDMGSFERLYHPLEVDERMGFVEGVQCGRHSTHMIGVWWFGGNPIDPQKGGTYGFDPDKQGYEQIVAGGFYGYATRRTLYLNHEYYWSTTQPWGPDVNFGLWVWLQGYKAAVDWSTVFGHEENGGGVKLPSDAKVTEIAYTRNTQTGEWGRHDTN